VPPIALVPAYNEAPRVAAAVRPLLASGAFARVLVVDDGSSDGTERAARAAGAEVLRTPRNLGKGGAMRWALSRLPAGGDVGFFDADLVGFRAEHARRMVEAFRVGGPGQVVGLRDYGPTYNALQAALEPITGERVVSRRVLDAVHPDDWRGFRVEVGINDACRRLGLPSRAVVLDGLKIVPKWQKVGPRQGAVDAAKMARQILVAMGEVRRR
jgi:glycosyltransferase involved in cell wall biosynthesis